MPEQRINKKKTGKTGEDVTPEPARRKAAPRKTGKKSAGKSSRPAAGSAGKHIADETKKGELYRRIVETANEGILQINADHVVTFVNQKMADMLGYTVEEMLGRHATLFTFEEDIPDHENRMAQRRKGLPGNYERRLRHKDGSVRWTKVTSAPIKDRKGRFAGSFGMFTEITEQKNDERRLIESQQKFQALVENTTDFIWEMDLAGKYTYCSPQIEELWGFKPGEMIGKSPFDLMLPEDKQLATGMFAAMSASPAPFQNLEVRSLDSAGRDRYLEISGIPFYDEGGKPRGYRGITRDITERRRSVLESEESRKQLHSLFTNMAEGVALHELVNDAHGHPVDYRLVDVNPQFETILGIRAEEARGKLATQLYSSAEAPFLKEYSQVAFSGEPLRFEVYFPPMDRYFNISAVPWGSGGFATIFTDITERKKAEEEKQVLLTKYRTLFNSFPMGITVADKDGKILEGNIMAEKLLGLSQQEHARREIDGKEWSIIRPDGTPMPAVEYASVRALRENLLVENVEMGIVKSPDETTWISVTAAPLPGTGVVISYADISERLRLQQENRRALEEWQDTFDSIPDMVTIQDSEFRLARVNRAFAAAFGTTPDKLTGRHCYEVMHGTNCPIETCPNVKTLRSGEIFTEDVYEPKLGIHLNVSTSPIREEKGKVTGTVHIAKDITGRKQAEEALRAGEERFSAAFNINPDPVAITDAATGKIFDVNPAYANWIGYPREELVGRHTKDLAVFVDPGDRDRVLQEIREKGSVSDVPIQYRVRSGEVRDTLFSASFIEFGGRQYLFSRAHDITELRQMERAMQEREEQYRLLADNADDVIWTTDADLNITYVSPSVYKLRGYQPHETRGKPVLETLTPESQQQARQYFELNIGDINNGSSGSMRLEIEQYRNDGSTVWVEAVVKALYDEAGQFTGLIGASRDITERRKAESELQLRSTLLDSANDSIYMLETDGRLLYVNDAFCRARGYTRDEALNMSVTDVATPEEAARHRDRVAKVIEKGDIVFETSHIRKDGSILPIEVHSRPVELNGRTCLLSIARDITERKRAESSLRETEAKYRTIIEHSGDFFYMFDLEANPLYLSPQGLTILGYTSEDFQKINWTDLLTDNPVNRQALKATAKAIKTGQKQPVYLMELRKKDGSTGFAEINESPLKDKDGQVIGLVGAMRDVTSRVRAEATLRENEEMLSSLLNSITETALLIDTDGLILAANDELARRSGVEPGQVRGKSMYELLPPDLAESSRIMLDRVIASGQPMQFEDERAGRYMLNSVYPVLDNTGRVSRLAVFAVDLTERRRAEKAVRKSEQRFKDIIEHITDIFYMLDRDYNMTYISPQAEGVIKLTAEQIRSNWRSLVSDNPLNVAARAKSDLALKTGEKQDPYLQEFVLPGGDNLWMEINESPVKNERGEVTGIVGIARDITGRRKMDEALKESEELFRNSLENAPDAVYMNDLEGNFLYGNSKAEDLIGYKREELVGKSFLEVGILPESSLIKASEILQDNIAGKSTGPDELELITKDGRTIPIEVNTSLLRRFGKSVVLAFARDISNRKAAEQMLRASEERFKNMASLLPQTIFETDTTNNFTFVNRQGYEMFGYGEADVAAGMNVLQTIIPEDRERAVANIAARISGKDQPSNEYTAVRKDGSTFPVAIYAAPIITDAGFAGLRGMLIDITDRKRSEDLIRRNEARLESMLRITQYQEKDMQDLLDFALEEAIQLTGSKIGYIYFYSEEKKEFTLNTWSRDVMKECAIQNPETVYQLEKTSVWGEAVRQRRPIMLNDFASPHPLQKGYPEGHAPLRRFLTIPVISGDSVVAVVGVANKQDNYDDDDIRQLTLLMDSVWKVVERRQAEERLVISETRYYKLLEEADEAAFILREGRIVYANAMARVLTGRAESDLVGRHFSEFLHADDAKRMLSFYENKINLDDLTPRERQCRLLTTNGAKWIEIKTLITEWEGAAAILYFTRDITDSLRAEQALKASERRFNEFFEHATNFCYMISPEGNILDLNRSAMEFLGFTRREDVVGRPVITTVYPPDSRERARQLFAQWKETGKLENEEVTVAGKDGEERSVLLTVSSVTDDEGKLLHSISIQTDITERKRLLDEQTRLSKLESVGTLAGGIAHDFNNILGAILGNVSMARADTPASGPAQECLLEAEKAILRATDLTRQLLTFSRGGAPVKKITSLREVITESAKFAVRGSTSRCNFEISPELWPAEVDAGQISQVISNLVINARQAMPSGGLINIQADNILLEDEQSLGRSLPLAAGNYIRITVHDQGVGIPAEHIDRVFDPYFTTKQDGSGLGLATCFSIVRNHGGHISIESRPGQGTTFFVYLPASGSPMPAATGGDRKEVIKLSGRVLVMDDEASLRNVVMALLKKIGFEVAGAANGAEALQLYQAAMQAKQPFDVVILDLTIPGGMGGKETIEKLREMDPSVVAVVSSGYTDDSLLSEYRSFGFSDIIAKPYTMDELRDTMRRVITKRRNPNS